MLKLKLTVDSRAVRKTFAEFPSRMQKASVRGLRRASELVVKRAKLNLRGNNSTASGLLSNSIWYEIEDGKLSAKIGPGIRSKVDLTGDPANYGRFVEEGRKPGRFPDPRILDWWIRRKLGKDPDAPADRGRMIGKGTLRVAIAQAIASRGTKPQPFLVPALTDSADEIRRVWQGELDAEVKKINAEGRR